MFSTPSVSDLHLLYGLFHFRMSRLGLFALILALVSSFTIAHGGGDVFVDDSLGRRLAPWWPQSPFISSLQELVVGLRAISIWDRVSRAVVGMAEESDDGSAVKVRMLDWFSCRSDPGDGRVFFVGVDGVLWKQVATPWRRVVHDNDLQLNHRGVVMRLVSIFRFGDVCGGYRRQEADWGVRGSDEVFSVSGGREERLFLFGPGLGLLGHWALGSKMLNLEGQLALVPPVVEEFLQSPRVCEGEAIVSSSSGCYSGGSLSV